MARALRQSERVSFIFPRRDQGEGLPRAGGSGSREAEKASREWRCGSGTNWGREVR